MLAENIEKLSPFDAEEEAWNVVIETPKHSHNKYKFEEKLGLFALSGVMPEGMSFPYDFGFLPRTRGDDGDPLDVLLLMDQPAFCGCLVPARLIGVIEAEQTERDGVSERNDRLVAVPVRAHNFSDCKSIKELNDTRIEEIAQFFVSYNRIHGKKFKLLGLHGPGKAESCAHGGIERFKQDLRKKAQGNQGKKKSAKKG